MLGRFFARCALFVCLSVAVATPANAQFWQCVTFARSITDIAIRGNAHTWWGQAAGRYARGALPEVGAVMAFKSSARMRLGHVATVSKIISAREVLLTHANWSYRGKVERDVRAVDVSANGDWSKVQVWYRGSMGLSSNPVYGFIYPRTEGMLAPVMMAAKTVARGTGLTQLAGLIDTLRTGSSAQ